MAVFQFWDLKNVFPRFFKSSEINTILSMSFKSTSTSSGKSGWLARSIPWEYFPIITFFQFSAFCNNTQFGRFFTFHLHIFQNLCHTHSFNPLAKYHVLPIQVWSQNCGDEGLGAIDVAARVGHAQQSLLVMLIMEIFTFRFFTTNAFSTCPILIWEVSTLNHQFLNNSMQRTSFEMERFPSGGSNAFFSYIQCTIIFCSFGIISAKQF